MMTNQICPADDTDNDFSVIVNKLEQINKVVAQIMAQYGTITNPAIITATEDHSNETKEQYDARIKAKAERRSKMITDELEKLSAKKKEDNKDKHWTDKLKPWPGAVGSLWELKI